MPFIAKNADDQLGHIIAKLEGEGPTRRHPHRRSLADHGPRLRTNGYFGDNVAERRQPELVLRPEQPWHPRHLWQRPTNAGSCCAAQPSTATSTTATSPPRSRPGSSDSAWAKKVATADEDGTLPGVIATYSEERGRRPLRAAERLAPDQMTSAESSWWTAHGQELVDTMAFAGSADVVGLLARTAWATASTATTAAPSRTCSVSRWSCPTGIRSVCERLGRPLVDLMPTVLRTMGIPLTAPMDGRAYKLPLVP